MNKTINLDKKIYVINFIHTSAVLLSSAEEVTRSLNLAFENERLSKLQLVKFKNKPDDLKTELSESGIISMSECFPWLIDEKGSMVD